MRIFVVVCALLCMVADVPMAIAKERKAPKAAQSAPSTPKKEWFLLGPKASQLMQKAERSGWGIRARLNLGFAATFEVQTAFHLSVGMLITQEHLAMTGFGELVSSFSLAEGAPYLPGLSEPKTNQVLLERGSHISLIYRWKANTKVPWGRQTGLRIQPFSSSSLVMGEQLELLWQPNTMVFLTTNGMPETTKATQPNTHLTVRGFFAWDRIKFGGGVMLPSGTYYKENNLSETKSMPGIRGAFEVAPINTMRLWIQGAYWLAGTSRQTESVGEEFWRGGVHAGGSVWFGARPIAIVLPHRWANDPRNVERSYPALPSRTQKGLMIQAEFGYRGQDLIDPKTIKGRKHEPAFAASGRLRGQWDWLQMEAAFVWRSFRWVMFEGAGVDPTKGLSNALLFYGSMNTYISSRLMLTQYLSLTAHLEARLPATSVGNGVDLYSINRGIYYSRELRSLLKVADPVEPSWLGALCARADLFGALSLLVEGVAQYEPNIADQKQVQQGGVVSLLITRKKEWRGALLLHLQGRF